MCATISANKQHKVTTRAIVAFKYTIIKENFIMIDKQNFEAMDETMTFTILNDEGKEIQCEVLFTFENEETGKNYIVYTDNSFDEEGNVKVYASIYNPDEDETKLLSIETEEEWKFIETILEQLQDDMNGDDE